VAAVGIDIRAAADRFVAEHDGITSWHCFSAGGYYDPANTSFGTMIGCDEHRLAGGAGFARHAHRGVEIVSVVLAGALRHETDGEAVSIGPGEILWQSAGAGLSHVEANAGDEELRFVQTTWLVERSGPDWAVRVAPFAVGGGSFAVSSGPVQTVGPAHVYVAGGSFDIAGMPLVSGDSVRADEPVVITGAGRVLVWQPDPVGGG
jgi:mannose-6-phosphate isomerase-like protein (cupin superfamily)